MLESGDRRETRLRRAGRLAAMGAFAGCLVAMLMLPGLAAIGMGAKKMASDFENMDVQQITRSPSVRSTVYSADGHEIATFFSEYREPVRLDQVSPIMKKTILAVEDARFYEHGALDVKGTLRALMRNTSVGEVREGGSSLTQQYAKNLLLANARTDQERQRVTAPTVFRKIRELRHALHLEQTMSKDQIFEGYLNIAYFGAGAYGVQAAAQRYFGKPASQLSLAEAALLAGITKNPYAYDPLLHPQAAKERRDTVLMRMTELKLITEAQKKELSAAPLKLKPQPIRGGCSTSRAPFYCMYVHSELIKLLSKGDPKRAKEAGELLQRGGYQVRTTLDWDSQRGVQQAVNAHTSHESDKVAAQAIVEVGTGHLKTLAISKRFGFKSPDTTLNLAADMAHGGGVGVSAGSTFKIFTLLAALEKGLPVKTSFHAPGSTQIGGYRDCQGRLLPPWQVKNSHESESGKFDLRTGTAQSVNTFYAKLQHQIGICSAVKMAHRFGMKRADGKPLQEVPSQVLGSNEIDMVHLAAAYAGIANHGVYCSPVALLEVTDPSGKKLALPKNECKQVVTRQTADTTYDIMRSVFGEKGTAAQVGKPSGSVAGKTGTCENFSCAVFAGISRNLSSAVAYWDYRGGFKYPVYGVYGAGTPASIWSAALSAAHRTYRPLVPVPQLNGTSLGTAMTVLQQTGLNGAVSAKPVASKLPKGSVAYVAPSTQSEQGGTVTIFLSNGPSG
ncbi:transglycosylase domain-containing protein [Actinocorallia populi]|uniref:transglycosylase domain-containing protein n=1 Tax=Actinocorallia populi TaxID=2079200 RepID=UPI000D09048C|nr:transglycosylase domain-containing protein [Actinocorallia populi]